MNEIAQIAAQTQSHQPAPGIQVRPDQVGWGPFTPSSGGGRYLQLVYPPSTTKGELQIGVIYTLWIPDSIKTVMAVIVHQHGASIQPLRRGQLLLTIWTGKLLRRNGAASFLDLPIMF